MEELKPCPFCKKEVARIWEDEGDFTVVCDWGKGGCGASGGYRGTEEEAVKAWNRRPGSVTE